MNHKEYRKIQRVVQQYVHRTPVLSSSIMNETYGAKLLFKCENFQLAGSFKIRGALFAVSEKLKVRQADVLTGHSSGNFAQALARTAQMFGKKAVLIMPENAPRAKIDAVHRYGAEIIFSGNKPSDREARMEEYLTKHPEAIFIHPSNDLDMIRGNASAAGELLESCPTPDHLLVPVGGGGLIAGTAMVTQLLSPETKVYGAEPAGADDARRSFHSGTIQSSLHPDTIADGLRTQLGDVNFPIIYDLVQDILTVSDREIIEAMKDIYRYLKIVIEPSSAVPLAVIRKYPEIFEGKINALIISGGNVDLRNLGKIFE